MSYKSYAQGGQFNTYSINLPIKAEINEDLRAAGDTAEQMELSQRYREKWANSYLSALNKKTGIERQNRDDNFEFLQNNFKRIYEGEQREFEGRLGELRREQHEAANAEPGFIEKLIPLLIDFAPKALAVVGQMQAANAAQLLEETTAGGRKLVQYYSELGDPGVNLFTESQRIGALLGADRRAAMAELSNKSKIPEETLGRLLIGSGAHQYSAQSISAKRVTQQISMQIQAAVAGQPEKGVKNLHSSQYSSLREQMTAIDNELHRLQVQAFGGKKNYEELADTVRQDIDKGNGSFKRGITASQTTEWKGRWNEVNTVVLEHDVDNAFVTNTVPNLLEDLTEINVRQGAGRVPRDAARITALKTLNSNYTIEGGGSSAEYQAKVGHALAKKLNLPGIPERKPGDESKFWQIYHAHHAKLRQGEVKLQIQQQQAVAAQSREVIETGNQFMLAHSIPESTAYWEAWKTSNKYAGLSADLQKHINNMASNPQAIRDYVKTKNSFEAKTRLTASHQKSVVIQVLAGDLAQGAAGKDWVDNNLTLINKTMSYAKIKFQEILTENPGLDHSVAYERAVVEAWTDQTGPNGNVKYINRNKDGTPTDPTKPILTNYSTGANVYKQQQQSRTDFIKSVNNTISSGSTDYLVWYSGNSNGILESVNTTNTLYKQRNPTMDISPQMVQSAINSEWIKTIADETRKAGIVKSNSQILNEQGEAWAKKTGQKWVPIDYVTIDDINKAAGQAHRDLQQIHTTSTSANLVQAHRDHHNNQTPYQLSRFTPAATFGTSSPYGPRVHPITRAVSDHAANDQNVPNRTPTTTLIPNGTVTDVKMDNGSAGNEYTVSYNYGGHTVEIRSLHNDEIHAQPGQVVNPGDIIGLSGSTGRSTGPHTHNEYYVDGQLVNGATFKINGKPIQEIFLGYYQ